MNEIISQEMAGPLAMTIIHSLWQFALIYAGLWAVLQFTRSDAARLRYRLGLMALLAMCVAPVITFLRHFEPAVIPPAGGSTLTAVAVAPETLAASALPQESAWEAWAPAMVTLWALGAAFFSLRLFGGFLYLRRLRRRDGAQAPAHITEALERLSAKLGLRRRVRVLMSHKATSPFIMGMVRPVLILPAGLMAGMPAAELESLLIHELAHVRRFDYAFNIIQSLAEAMFFYHPAVWMLGRFLREERENCCDAEVLALTGDKTAYAKALLSLEERRTGLVAAVGASDGNLLRRIRRIVGGGGRGPRYWHGAAALALLITLMLVLVPRDRGLLAGLPQNPPTEWEETVKRGLKPGLSFADMEVMPVDTPRKKVIITEDDGTEISMEYKGGELQRVQKNGREVPKEEWAAIEERAHVADVHIPPMPPMPRFEGDFKFDFDMPEMPELDFDAEDFDERMEEYGKRMEAWGERFGKEMEKSFGDEKQWEEYGRRMEDWGRELELKMKDMDLEGEWSEELERSMEQLEKELEPAMRKLERELEHMFDGEWEEDLEREMEELERRMEHMHDQREEELDRAHDHADRARDHAEREAREHGNATPLRKALERDGLVEPGDRIRLKVNGNTMQLNGKKLNDTQYERYARILEKNLKVKIDKHTKMTFDLR